MAQTMVLPTGSLSIGRQAGNDLVLVHPLVSRRHARVDCTADGCQITDLGSTHGTMVNRVRLEPETPHPLVAGDVIEIGPFRLQFEEVPVSPAEPVTEAPDEETAAPDEETPDGAAPDRRAFGPALELVPPPEKNGEFTIPPGLSKSDSRYLDYLPDIYSSRDNRFIPRFLALLESILSPIEWNIDNFDLYLQPQAAPLAFLPWLANWFEIAFDDSWSEQSQRTLLTEAHQIYGWRGTAWALSRILELYTGTAPEIDDQSKNLDPFTFIVKFSIREEQVNRSVLEQIIDASKPAHTSYTLIFEE
jgi:phage tail-like protein